MKTNNRGGMRRGRRSEAGVALVSSLLISFSLMMLAGLLLSVSMESGRYVARDEAITRARLAADEGIYLSVAELRSGVDADGDGLGVVATTGTDARTILTAVDQLSAGVWQIRSRGAFGGVVQTTAVVAELSTFSISFGGSRAAIVARGPVKTSGSIVIDGRDHDTSGTLVTGIGVPGVATMSTVTMSGASKIGGTGIAPTNFELPLTALENDSWKNFLNEDGDLAVDEEVFDGIDDDGDGEIDEDVNSFPTSPDILLKLPEGTLKNYSKSKNTYFASAAEFNDYIAANGGSLPGGCVFYLDFDSLNPANLSATLNDPPSILVHHNATGTATMTNIHKYFKGLVLADQVGHLNGDFVLVGSLMSFSPTTVTNTFGNGNAKVLYSSTVLANLPGANGSSGVAGIRCWRRAASDL